MRTYRFVLLFGLINLGLVATMMPAAAAVRYWDTTGATPGAADGGIADGDWNDTAPNWSTSAAGDVATDVWTAGDDAVFSAGNDVGTDPDVAGAFITIGGTQVANSILVEEGYIEFVSGTADTGAGTVTVNSGATLAISLSTRLNSGGKVVLNGGTLEQRNPGSAGSFVLAGKGLEVDGTGTIVYEGGGGGCDCSIYTPTGGVAITGAGGTPENGGAGTLIKQGAGEIRYQGAGLPLTSYAKLVVEDGLFRLGFAASVDLEERGFGAVPLSVLPDAITLDGGAIAHSFNPTTLHENRGITIGPNGGTWRGGSVTVPGPISGSGMFSVTGGAVTLSNSNNSATFSGKLNVASGTLTVPADSALGAAPGSPTADSITLGNATPTTGTLAVSATDTLSANRGITLAGPGRINVASGGNTVTYDGAISGSGLLTKMGDGALVLGGAQTYSGGTDVYGRLIVNNTSGSGTGSGGVTVKADGGASLGGPGTLGGTGSVSALVTVETGGTIAPGNGGVGTLTLGGSATFSEGAGLAVDLSGSTADQLAVVGNLDLSAIDNFLNVAGVGSGSSWVIATYSGTLTGIFESITTGFTVDYGTGANSMITLNSTGPMGLPGDFNGDNIVDAADYTVWRDNLGAADESSLMGNGDGLDGVDPGDYALWKSNFGATPGSGALGTAAVPEPATWTLALLVGAALAMVRRK